MFVETIDDISIMFSNVNENANTVEKKIEHVLLYMIKSIIGWYDAWQQQQQSAAAAATVKCSKESISMALIHLILHALWFAFFYIYCASVI